MNPSAAAAAASAASTDAAAPELTSHNAVCCEGAIGSECMFLVVLVGGAHREREIWKGATTAAEGPSTVAVFRLGATDNSANVAICDLSY